MIGAFFAWWFGQLAELLPAWLRRPSPPRADALIVAPTTPLDQAGVVAVALRRAGKETQLGRFLPGAPELSRLPHSPRLPVVLRVGQADILEKTLNLPLAARSELDQVLAFEMDRETPFTAEEVYWAYLIDAVDPHNGRISVRLILIPKARLAPLLQPLAQAGFAPKWAEIADGIEDFPLLPFDGHRAIPQHRSRWLVRGAAACCAVLGLAAIATPFIRQELHLAALESEAKPAQASAAEAQALRREIESLSRGADLVRSAQDKAARPLEVLATVTRLLPDDTYLTELELRQRKLTLSGRSAGAARLIGVLAGDGRLQNPVFSAPVTRVEALRADVFTIVTEVRASP